MSYFLFDRPQTGSPDASDELRSQFNALGTTNYTATETQPANPRNGMLRVNASDENNIKLEIYLGSWIVLVNNIAVTTSFARRKESPAFATAVWTWDHNLGYRPSVQCWNSSNKRIYPLEVEHASVNRVVVTHSSPQSGYILAVG